MHAIAQDGRKMRRTDDAGQSVTPFGKSLKLPSIVCQGISFFLPSFARFTQQVAIIVPIISMISMVKHSKLDIELWQDRISVYSSALL